MVETLSSQYPVQELCLMLQVSRSGYYAWHRGPETARQAANRLLTEEIRRVHRQKKGRYGSPRITEQLRREGHPCNHKRVERLMRQTGLRGCSSRRHRVSTTDSDHDQPVAPNRLLERAAPRRPNEVWVADITYVPTAEGWLFVAAVMDLYSRHILGWSVWENLQAGGPLQALQRALVKRSYPKGVIHHSDRGIQYACHAYRQQLQAAGLLASMSRKGNCYDNAAIEAFWSTLKREAMAQSATWSKDRVRRELFEYIEGDYNRSRLHSSLGYQSPVDFEHQNN
ncbi:MAG TPA: IS3 family transposase [Candidatus Methylomirabilis sp.]|nr:IS3 family transposase [Candidatus Methylomirabilis sp.]